MITYIQKKRIIYTKEREKKHLILILIKQRSRHHNLLKENYGKPKKQDKASLRKQISSPGVGYVWERC